MNRHICLVLRHSLFNAMTLLYSVTALLLRGAGTYCLCFGTSVLYLWVPIVLRPSYSLLLVYAGKHLYDKNLNKET